MKSGIDLRFGVQDNMSIKYVKITFTKVIHSLLETRLSILK